MASLLLRHGLDATVTVCHSRTRDLAGITRQADILIAAIGRAESGHANGGRLFRPHFVREILSSRDFGDSQMRLPLARMSTGLMLVFTSRFGVVRGTLVLLALLYALMGIAVLDLLWDRAKFSAGEARFIAQLDGAHALESAHYADQRDPLVHALLPHIPTMNVRGNYLRLVIPYQVQQHPAALESICPGDELALRAAANESHAAYRALDAEADSLQRMRTAETAEATAAARVLDCAARLHAVALNGEPLQVSLSFRTSPEPELPAYLAMIPIGHLPPGQHVLEVARLPTAARDGLLADREARPAAPPRRITFWK
jgi:hypothetical protein